MVVIPDERVPEPHRRYAPGRGLLQPVRLSQPVADLAAQLSPDRIEPGRLPDAIALLEKQLRLREVDAHNYIEWERAARSIGTPAALTEVEQVRTGFIDVISGVHIRAEAWASPRAADLQFSGNLPALSPAASTAQARAVAELDTQALTPLENGGSTDSDAVTQIGDRRIGDTGWLVHDAVFGDGGTTPIPHRRNRFGTVAARMREVASGIMRGFARRGRQEGAR